MPTGTQIMNTVKTWQESNEWGYLFGARGQYFVDSLYEQFKADALAAGDTNRYNNVLRAWELWKYRNVADCSGIIYKAMRENGMTLDRFYTSSVPWTNGTKYAITSFANIPNIPGIALWRSGHIALLVDRTAQYSTVEAMSTTRGVCRGSFYDTNGNARFTHWGYLEGVTYSGATDPTPEIDWISFHPTRTLQYNDVGDDVKLMQLALNHANNAGLSGTGNYRTATKAAVQNFQQSKGLTVDGICGPNTWRALDFTLATNYGASNAAPVFKPFRNVKNGNSGDDVRLLQLALNEAVNAGLSGTGSFGSSTENAVRNFQSANNLTVDGIVGRATWTALGFTVNY